jgi:membrane-associated phospholipid phosphatase
MVGSSRIILRQHTLSEVNWGTLIGTVCGFVTILIV